jgi:hypothetical protein
MMFSSGSIGVSIKAGHGPLGGGYSVAGAVGSSRRSYSPAMSRLISRRARSTPSTIFSVKSAVARLT